MPETVTVRCSGPAGLVLQLYDMVEGEMGIKRARYKGEPVTLRPGVNENIDADFMSAWMEQNKDGPLAKGGFVRIEENS
jgi:hypothetical protein